MNDARFQAPQSLAGPHYDDMIQSKEAAMQYLASLDDRVRLAAILICQSVWECGPDRTLIEACQDIAASASDPSVRCCALSALGRASRLSKADDVSHFLARLVVDSTQPIEVRRDAYWALRHVQFGIADTDFDTFLKGTICLIKPIIRANQLSEEDAKADITPQEGFPDGFWESAEDIDFDFVAQFASPK